MADTTAAAAADDPGPRLARGVLLPGMTTGRFAIVLSALMMGSLLAAMDTAIVNTALPTIAGELGGFSSYAWVGAAYLLCSTIATPLAGKLSDLYGRKRAFNVAIAGFTVASLACAAAQTMGQLIAARGLQGVFGGAIQAVTFAILADIITPRERGRYIGIYVGAGTVAAIAGPLLGGVIVDAAGWRWTFLINLPLGVIALVGSVRFLPLPHQTRQASLDVRGAALLTLAIASLLVALEQGREGWLRPPIVVLIVLAVVITPFFWRRERRFEEPIIPPSLFANAIVWRGLLMGFCLGAISFGAATLFLPIFFQNAVGVSPTRSGLYVSPMVLGAFFGTIVVGRLVSRTGRYKPWPIGAVLLVAAGALALARIDVDVPYWQLAIPMYVMGVGTGVCFTCNSIAVQNAVPMSVMGATTAAVQFFRSLGGAIGSAVAGALFIAVTTSTVRDGLPADLRDRSVSSLIREPRTVRALPPDVRDAVVHGIAVGARSIYLYLLGVAAVFLVAAVTMPEIPLATSRSEMTGAHAVE